MVKIDVQGKIIIFGFLNVYVYIWFLVYLQMVVQVGVLGVCDMYGFVFVVQWLSQFNDFIGYVDYYVVGLGVIVFKGYGIQFGMIVLIIDSMILVCQFVFDWVKEGVDYIKIFRELLWLMFIYE